MVLLIIFVISPPFLYSEIMWGEAGFSGQGDKDVKVILLSFSKGEYIKIISTLCWIELYIVTDFDNYTFIWKSLVWEGTPHSHPTFSAPCYATILLVPDSKGH